MEKNLDHESKLALEIGRVVMKALKEIYRGNIKADDFLSKIAVPGLDESVGSRIRKKRETLKINQQELARLLGLSQGEVSKIEKGERVLSSVKAEKIAKFFKCSPVWILTGKK